MKKIHQILNNFREKLSSAKDSYKTRGIRPLNDWKIIVSLILILICLEIVGSYYFYVLVNEGQLFISNNNIPQDQAPQINQNLMDRVIGDINLRKNTFDNVQKKTSVPPEPSS